MARSYMDECSYLEQISDYCFRIKKGFVPNMRVSLQLAAHLASPGYSATVFLQVEGQFYVNDNLKSLMYEELKHHSAAQGSRARVS